MVEMTLGCYVPHQRVDEGWVILSWAAANVARSREGRALSNPTIIYLIVKVGYGKETNVMLQI
jgi:hypothetical protein